jgi:hypothetical protein
MHVERDRAVASRRQRSRQIAEKADLARTLVPEPFPEQANQCSDLLALFAYGVDGGVAADILVEGSKGNVYALDRQTPERGIEWF